MTEPLYTYEYETVSKAKGITQQWSNEDAIEWVHANNDAIVYQEYTYLTIVKLTNTHTGEVIYEVER